MYLSWLLLKAQMHNMQPAYVHLNLWLKVPVLQKVLVEAVESIKLMHPSRVTLRQNISAGPFMSHDEPNSDLKSLDWLECSNCSVTSVHSHNVHDEAVTSTELVVYEGKEEEPIESNRNCKRPVRNASEES